MQHKMFIIVSVCLFIIASTVKLISGDGKYIGRIGAIDNGKKEIIVNVEGGRAIKMGEQLYVRSGDTVVIMEAAFPMQTTVKCRLLKASSGYFRQLERGMIVYKYESTVTEDKVKETSDIGQVEMVFIKGGSFMMGSPENEKDRKSDERQHRVTVSAFRIGKYEVTQKQYNDIMGENTCHFKGDDLPVDNISWNEAVEFCNRLSEKSGLKPYYRIENNLWGKSITIRGGDGFRLPTEAEWEYACRAGTVTKYYWGEEMDGKYCWYNDNSGNMTHPAGQKKANAFGLYDMIGNVWEWCWDWHSLDYCQDCLQADPKGPGSGYERILRGGSWSYYDYKTGSAGRFRTSPTNRNYNFGFRVARSAQ